MILTYPDILDALNRDDIIIQPFDPSRIGTNSVDLTLGKYVVKLDGRQPLDLKKPTDITIAEIPDEGYLLVPGMVYLCATAERTWTKKHIGILHGKSSIARMGISVHDAGFGDLGFKGHWTLELTVAQPITIYAGIPIVQIAFHEPKSMPDVDYMNLKTSSYTNAWEDPKPQPSALWKKIGKTSS